MKIGIDIKDFINAKKHNWNINSNGYYRNSKTKDYLHQFIIGKKDNSVCDHINRNKLDNRRSNLRHVSRLENSLNKDSVINARGIYFEGNRWRACISVKNKTIKLGSFKTKEDAINSRIEAVKKHRPHFQL